MARREWFGRLGRGVRRVDAVLVLLLAISLLIKLALAVQLDDVPLRKDERAYVNLAQSLIATGHYPRLFLAPGYPFFVATLLEATGSLEPVRVTQVLLGTLTALLVYLVASPYLGIRAARWAAAIVAFDPVLGAFGLMIWTETLFLFLLWAALWVLLGRFALDSSWRWLGAGVLLGAAALVRPLILGITPFLVVWLLWRTWRARRNLPALDGWPRPWRAPIRACALLAVGALVTILPWTARNYRETGAFIFIDTNSAYSSLIGTEPAAMFLDKDDTWSRSWAWIGGEEFKVVLLEAPGSVQRLAFVTGIRNVREDPVRYLAACFFEGTHLWTLDNYALRHLRNGWYGGEIPRGFGRTLLVASVGIGVLVLGAGLLGLLCVPSSPLRAILVIVVGYSALVHTVLFSLSRYQVPMRPFLAVGAAWLLAATPACRRALWSDAGPTPRGWVALLFLALLLVAWGRDLPMLVDMWNTGGANHRFVTRP
jgi:hypothetical protein